jgi:hypothetical protein
MRTKHIEAAIQAIIDSGDKSLLDVAAWLAERLPESRQRRSLKKIVKAI